VAKKGKTKRQEEEEADALERANAQYY